MMTQLWVIDQKHLMVVYDLHRPTLIYKTQRMTGSVHITD